MEQSLLQNLMVSQLVKKFPAFYGIELVLSQSQKPATCSFPEPDQYSPLFRNQFI